MKEDARFAASEIVELGIQIERDGVAFYNTLADKTKNPKAKEVFKYLAQEETRHIDSFKKLLFSVQGYEPRESYPQDYFAYMDAIASEYVFTKKNRGAQIAMAAASDKEAIDLALGIEKDSIIFYEEMKEIMSGDDKSLLDELISQEKEHIRKLWDLRGN